MNLNLQESDDGVRKWAKKKSALQTSATALGDYKQLVVEREPDQVRCKN